MSEPSYHFPITHTPWHLVSGLKRKYKRTDQSRPNAREVGSLADIDPEEIWLVINRGIPAEYVRVLEWPCKHRALFLDSLLCASSWVLGFALSGWLTGKIRNREVGLGKVSNICIRNENLEEGMRRTISVIYNGIKWRESLEIVHCEFYKILKHALIHLYVMYEITYFLYAVDIQF